MKTFKIPVSWEMYGYVDIEAETLEEALNSFDNSAHAIDLPSCQNYVDGSFEREEDIYFIKEFNGTK